MNSGAKNVAPPIPAAMDTVAMRTAIGDMNQYYSVIGTSLLTYSRSIGIREASRLIRSIVGDVRPPAAYQLMCNF